MSKWKSFVRKACEGSRSEKMVNNDSSLCARAKRKEGRSPVHVIHRKNTAARPQTQSHLCFRLTICLTQIEFMHFKEAPPLAALICFVLCEKGIYLQSQKKRDTCCTSVYILSIPHSLERRIDVCLDGLHTSCLQRFAL